VTPNHVPARGDRAEAVQDARRPGPLALAVLIALMVVVVVALLACLVVPIATLYRSMGT
jgi:hypothetical protein